MKLDGDLAGVYELPTECRYDCGMLRECQPLAFKESLCDIEHRVVSAGSRITWVTTLQKNLCCRDTVPCLQQ